MSLTVDVSDCLADLVRAQSNLGGAVERGVRRSAEVSWRKATETTLYKDHSGSRGLRATTRLAFVGNGMNSTARVFASRFYASMVENGTKAVDGKLMRMVINGQVLFRTKRKASAARPFMHIAEQAGDQVFTFYVQSEVDAVLK